MRNLYIGLDIGTTNVKGLLVDERGNIIAKETAPLSVFSPRPGWNEQDPESWWKAAADVLKRLSERADGRIVALASSGQMHSLVLLDDRGSVLRRAILWNDQRSFVECERITDAIGESNLISTLGNPVYPGFTLPKVLWIKRNEPELYEKIHKILLPKDYINYVLTGRLATEYSDASGTVMLDMKRKVWAEDILGSLGLSTGILPDIIPSHGAVGKIRRDPASKLGLPEDLLVIAGGADNACSALGMGVVEEGDYMVSLGTSGTVLSPTVSFEPDPKGRVHFFFHVVPDTYYHMGVMLSASFSLEWFKERFLEEDYDEINEEVGRVPPGSNGVMFLPYLNGERTPHRDPFARGCFIGISTPNSKWDLVRAVYEGVAFGLRDSFDILRNDIGIAPEHVRIVGGGAKSRIWREIVANVLGHELERTATEEGGSYGAAILAVAGSEGENPVKISKDWVKIKERVEFDPSVSEYYDRRVDVFRRTYRALKDVFRDL